MFKFIYYFYQPFSSVLQKLLDTKAFGKKKKKKSQCIDLGENMEFGGDERGQGVHTTTNLISY